MGKNLRNRWPEQRLRFFWSWAILSVFLQSNFIENLTKLHVIAYLE